MAGVGTYTWGFPHSGQNLALRAMGLPTHRTQNSLRFSLGLFSNDEEVDRVIEVLPRLVEKLRGLTKKTVSV